MQRYIFKKPTKEFKGKKNAVNLKEDKKEGRQEKPPPPQEKTQWDKQKKKNKIKTYTLIILFICF